MKYLFLLLGLLALGAWAYAADPPPNTDEELFRALIGENAIPSEAEPAVPSPGIEADSGMRQPMPMDPASIERLLAGLRQAEQRLKAGEADRSAQEAQSEVIAELQRIIDSARQNPPPSQQNSEDNPSSANRNEQGSATPLPEPASQADPAAGQGSGAAAGTPAANRDGKSDESSDRLRDPRGPSRGIPDFRADLVNGTWGHLPPRLRERLLNAGSDRYVPQYDPLVRKYFESLADPDPKRSAEPGR